MAAADAQFMASDRLQRLLALLECDPGNANLRLDAAETAYQAGDLTRAQQLLEGLDDTSSASAAAANLAGKVALRAGDGRAAAAAFERVEGGDPQDGAVRANLAWAKAMDGRYEEADRLLDDRSLAAAPLALRLKIEVLHHLGRLDDALALGAACEESEDRALHAALAIVALDAEQRERARTHALRAGDAPGALVTLGLLALEEHDEVTAARALEQALERQPDNARALLGLGVLSLNGGNPTRAASAFEQAAQTFSTHVGSWVAAGWAQVVAGEHGKARANFEAAVAANPKFSEGHGGLAVLDFIAGNVEQATEQTKIALRLDSNSFGGRLAQILQLERKGQTSRAEQLREAALATALDRSGLTLAEAVATMARRRH